MNNRIALLATIEILSALSMGVFILAMTYRVLKYIGRTRFDIHPKNLAYSIFMACVLFSIGYMISSVIQPLLSLFRLLANQENETLDLILSFMLRGGLYIGLSYLIGAMVCLLGVMIYTWITPIDEFKELKNNNVGVAVIVGCIMITLALLTRDGVSLLIESFIPYPETYPSQGGIPN
jgi:uncharacterized membrane protein YjfL (UPF0719 family)